MNDMSEREYVGFWPRVGAAIIDTLCATAVIVPLLAAVYGWTVFVSETAVKGPVYYLINYALPPIVVVAFWIARQATPGKMVLSTIIVDAKSGGTPSKPQFILRYLGYFLSGVPLFLGFFWIAFDKKKQGWHDKLAGTVVVRLPKK